MFRRPSASRLLVLLAFVPLLMSCGGGSVDGGKPELWIIGLDCADWDQIRPLMNKGGMPHLKSLVDDGASGVLLSDEPMLSPLLWNSIGTGKTADQHGITWFMTDAPDGTKVPISSRERRVRTFWNIATEAGLSCGIVGWWATWPAEPVDGYLVSDYVGWHSFGVTGRDAFDEGKTWPPSLMRRIEELMTAPEDVPMSLMTSLVHLPEAELAPDPHADPYSDRLLHLRQSIATSRTYTDLVIDRLAERRTDVMSVYYEGTDAISHLFGPYAPPRQDWINDADYAAYGEVVDAYWRWQDGMLGELLEHRGPRTTVMVLSDHGFRKGDERRKKLEFNIDLADKDHMIDGMIVLNGPDIAEGVRIEGADIYDVAPTILYLLGLPVAEDMVGHVMTDAFRPEALAASPVESVPTYETTRWRVDSDLEIDPAVARNMEQMLQSLGYIAGGDDDPAGGAAPAAAPIPSDAAAGTAEQTVNLATVLMTQGRVDEAAEMLREALVRFPDDAMVRLNLGQALARSGKTDEAETVLRDLVADEPDMVDAHADYAYLLAQLERYDDAIDAFDGGLALDPSNVDMKVNKGYCQFLEGRVGAAETTLSEALAEDPRHHDGQVYMGTLKAAGGDLAGAASALWRAHELEPANAATAVALADVLQRQGDPRQALSVLRRVRDNGGESVALSAKEGELHMMMRDPASAVGPLERVVEAEPLNADVLGNLGMAYAMTGRLPEAATTFEKVVELTPNDAAAHGQLGAFYMQMRRADDAVRELGRALELQPGNPMLHLNIGMLRHERGDLDGARAAYEKAVEIDGDFAPALYNLGMIEGQQGNTEAAERLIRRARALDPTLPDPSAR